ncbi:thermonuclease family protein [Metarhizobium album]|uniref:thermonuclease family protein n=1 Tax=Metarhizobium album TaxID=2182425 RepID=UPI000FFF0875|nr:thermonuclease family protein [Rhizobium album]
MKAFLTTTLTGFAGILIWGFLLVNGAQRIGTSPDIQADISTDTLSVEELQQLGGETTDPSVEPAEAPEERLPVPEGTSVASPDGTTENTAKDTSVTAEPLAEPGAIRPVEPEIFASPLTDGATSLERVEGPADKVVKPVKKEKPVLIPRPNAVNAGTLTAGERTLILSGLVPTDIERLCPDVSGKQWPCGVVARTSLRLFLRNRSVNCDLPGDDETGEIATTCRLGERDIGAWLVENGWAEAEKGSVFETLGEEARTARRGLYGDDPRRTATPDATDTIEP